MSPFAIMLRELREKRNLRQKDAAELLGYEQSYLSALETGSKGLPKPDFIQRLYKAFTLSELEKQELNEVIKASDRRYILPANSSPAEYKLFQLIKRKFGQLNPHQIDLIFMVLESSHLCSYQVGKERSKGREESRM